MRFAHVGSVDRRVVGVIEQVSIGEIVDPFNRYRSSGSHLEGGTRPGSVVSPEAGRRKVRMHLSPELGHLDPVMCDPVRRMPRLRDFGGRLMAHIFSERGRFGSCAADPGRDRQPCAGDRASLQHCASGDGRS